MSDAERNPNDDPNKGPPKPDKGKGKGKAVDPKIPPQPKVSTRGVALEQDLGKSAFSMLTKSKRDAGSAFPIGAAISDVAKSTAKMLVNKLSDGALDKKERAKRDREFSAREFRERREKFVQNRNAAASASVLPSERQVANDPLPMSSRDANARGNMINPPPRSSSLPSAAKARSLPNQAGQDKPLPNPELRTTPPAGGIPRAGTPRNLPSTRPRAREGGSVPDVPHDVTHSRDSSFATRRSSSTGSSRQRPPTPPPKDKGGPSV